MFADKKKKGWKFMKKVYICFSLILISIVIIIVFNKNDMQDRVKELGETTEKLRAENQEHESKYNSLLSYISIQKEEMDTLKKDIQSKNLDYQRIEITSERESDTLSNLQIILRSVYQNVNDEIGSKAVAKLLGIFNIETITNNAHVGSLTVSNIIKNEDENRILSYQVDFNGDIELNGYVMTNEAYGGYIFFVDKEHFNQIPHTIDDLVKGKIIFEIANIDELEKMFGEKLTSLAYEEKLSFKAVFSDYTVRYIAESHASNSANIIKVVTE